MLEDARKGKIAAGPSGPPKSVVGPGGPPTTVAGPSGGPPSGSTGPANVALATSESKKSGPPPAQSTVEQPIVAESTSALEDGSTFEDAGNGYFYRKMANGGYEQQIYIKNSEGQYVPYQAE